LLKAKALRQLLLQLRTLQLLLEFMSLQLVVLVEFTAALMNPLMSLRI
jgi:hypothetical protein